MQVFPAPHIPFGNALEKEFFFFVGKLLASALKPFRVWHVNKKRENATAHDFVDKGLYEERRPRLNYGAFVNFITTSDLLHTSDRLNDSLRFIDESIRKSESLI